MPDIKVSSTGLPVELVITSSTLEENPLESIVPLTMAVAIAMPVTLPEFRERLTRAEVTPYLLPFAEEKIAALLGEMNSDEPELMTNMENITYQIGVLSVIKDISNKPQPARNKPMVVKSLVPNLSERLPLKGPKMIRLIALGISTNEIWAGVNLNAA